MDWNLDFISQADFRHHVENTIAEYGQNLESYNIKKFNSNLVDPIKMVFDKSIYRASWEEIVSNEIFRQRDKANNNSIGYFHQRIFQYMSGCRVPDNGTEGGWDVIYQNDDGIELPDGDKVHTIYVEMKNKHNTMNSAASGKTYIKMQNQLLKDDDCACFLVEAIAKRSQNIKWETTVDKNKVSHRRIRRVSIDKFYEIVTGEAESFYHICMVLPHVIDEVLAAGDIVNAPQDTVFDELRALATRSDISSEDLAFAMAIYLLGFSTYNGFSDKKDIVSRMMGYASRLRGVE